MTVLFIYVYFITSKNRLHYIREAVPIAAALFDAPCVEEPGLETVGVLVLVGQ